MGKIFAKIELINTRDVILSDAGQLPKASIRKMEVNILVDSGAYNLAINETIKEQLGLPIIDEQIFQLANGQQEKYPIVGPIDLRFENRATTTRAVLLPGDAEPLLGQIPLEDMDVVLLPREERMIVNPDTPLIARKDLL
jgi:clan AA aspartic protease